jgi:RimJ/RimL family protein N-acetyltransferase
MIAYLYRWKIRPQHEESFIQAWSQITRHLLTQGSLGSRLHRADDGLFYAYAQWPDEKTYAGASFTSPDGEFLREQMKDATEEVFVPVLLDPPVDLLSRLPSTPTLETQRLLLRPHQMSDYADVLALWTDPKVYHYITGQPCTEQQAWSRLLQYSGHWDMMGYGSWAVIEKQSGGYVGTMGFADFRRAVEPPILKAPELGWVMATQFWGKGYATEALRCIQNWGDARFGTQPTYCIIHPENAASLKVAGKLGYLPVGDATYDRHPITVFQRNLGLS